MFISRKVAAVTLDEETHQPDINKIFSQIFLFIFFFQFFRRDKARAKETQELLFYFF